MISGCANRSPLPKIWRRSMLEIITRRYERASTLMISNRTVEDWHKLRGCGRGKRHTRSLAASRTPAQLRSSVSAPKLNFPSVDALPAKVECRPTHGVVLRLWEIYRLRALLLLYGSHRQLTAPARIRSMHSRLAIPGRLPSSSAGSASPTAADCRDYARPAQWLFDCLTRVFQA